jgi:hypothetical protein
MSKTGEKTEWIQQAKYGAKWGFFEDTLVTFKFVTCRNFRDKQAYQRFKERSLYRRTSSLIRGRFRYKTLKWVEQD